MQIPNYYGCHDASDLEHRSPFFIACPRPSEEGSDGFIRTNDDAGTVAEEAKNSRFVQVLASWSQNVIRFVCSVCLERKKSIGKYTCHVDFAKKIHYVADRIKMPHIMLNVFHNILPLSF